MLYLNMFRMEAYTTRVALVYHLEIGVLTDHKVIELEPPYTQLVKARVTISYGNVHKRRPIFSSSF